MLFFLAWIEFVISTNLVTWKIVSYNTPFDTYAIGLNADVFRSPLMELELLLIKGTIDLLA